MRGRPVALAPGAMDIKRKYGWCFKTAPPCDVKPCVDFDALPDENAGNAVFKKHKAKRRHN